MSCVPGGSGGSGGSLLMASSSASTVVKSGRRYWLPARTPAQKLTQHIRQSSLFHVARVGGSQERVVAGLAEAVHVGMGANLSPLSRLRRGEVQGSRDALAHHSMHR